MFLRSFAVFLLIAVNATLAGAKADPWVEVRTPHFIVISDASENRARHVANEFERMRAVFHKRFPKARVDAAFPIIVLALKDRKDIQALEPQVYLAKGQLDIAGLFLRTPDKNYVLIRLDVEGDHPYATVYHEYTHFVLSRDEEQMPLWLNEGLAEFFQTTEIRDKEVLLGQPSVENVMLLRRNRLLPLATLFSVDHNSPYYHEENKGSIFYAEAWALTHYFEFKDRHDHSDHLAQYLALVNNNVDPVTAAASAFGDLKVLEKNLSNYVAQPSFPFLTTPGSTEVDESAFKARPITSIQADAVRADFLAYENRAKDSRALLDRILQQDPDNVAAYETMGYLAYREGNLAEAAECYGHAVKLDSQNFLAHYQYAVISMQIDISAASAPQIEASLRAATKLNPEFAPAFDQLAVFYLMQNKELDQAYLSSLTAVQLEPFNVGFRMNAANLLMQMKRPTDALAVLQVAARMAKDPAQLTMILRERDLIQRFQANLERQKQQERDAIAESQSAVQSSAQPDEPLTGSEPAEPPEDPRHGPRRTAIGTLADVECSWPAIMHLKLVGGPKPLSLRTRNYYKVAYTALNFQPSSNLKPCEDLKTMKAKVVYFEDEDTNAAGQIIAIELRK